MDRPLQWPHRWACRRECNLSVDTSCTWCARPVCMKQPYRPHAGLASLTIIMAWPTFCVAIVHICKFCFIYCGLRFYAQSHSDNGHVHATAQQREDRLQQQRQVMKDNYDKICSENRQLMHCIPGSRKTRKREEQETKPWRKVETKPEWRKRNVRLWETSMKRGDDKTCNFHSS